MIIIITIYFISATAVLDLQNVASRREYTAHTTIVIFITLLGHTKPIPIPVLDRKGSLV